MLGRTPTLHVDMSQRWGEDSIPDQSGKTVLVTGASSGIGWETARALAQRGAHVLLGARNEQKAERAIERIAQTAPSGSMQPWVAELSDLESVSAAAERLLATCPRLDALINNAGIMWTPYAKTAQGFEQQLGVNHLAPFALTGWLLPLLLDTDGSRVVNVSSQTHRTGRIDFTDLQSERSYDPRSAYAQSKLANLLFTSELQSRLQAAGATTIAVAAHPGFSNTNLGHENAGGLINTVVHLFTPLVQRTLTQSSAQGALPTLRAATDEAVTGNQYYGPDGFSELRGHPVPVGRSSRAANAETAAALWEVSAELTGVSYAELATTV